MFIGTVFRAGGDVTDVHSCWSIVYSYLLVFTVLVRSLSRCGGSQCSAYHRLLIDVNRFVSDSLSLVLFKKKNPENVPIRAISTHLHLLQNTSLSGVAKTAEPNGALSLNQYNGDSLNRPFLLPPIEQILPVFIILRIFNFRLEVQVQVHDDGL